MKNIFISFFVLLSFSLFSQQRTGISYQALILNPNGEQLPGYNNQNAPLVNTDICIEFLITDENSSTEYSETQSVKTDKYGMVNLSIGNGSFAGGYSGGWSGIVWSEKSKKLKVNLDTTGSCSSFTEISNQDLTAVPFALFAPGLEGLDGETAYEIWLSEGNIGSVQDYLDSLKGEKGDDGLSAYQIWIDAGNTGTEAEFIDFLKGEKGDDGKSAYQTWLDAGNTGTEAEFIDFLKGEDGADGKSAYQTWIDAGNTGTEAEFIDFLKGEDGVDGKSAYQTWIDSGNTGTEAEFISSLSGDSALQSLIKTTVEASGDNCTNGGIKIETGLDSDGDGVLGVDEIETSQTKYLCNGDDGVEGSDGADGGSNGSNQFFSSFSEVKEVQGSTTGTGAPYDYTDHIAIKGSWFTGVSGNIYETGYGAQYFKANFPDELTYELEDLSSELLLNFNKKTGTTINQNMVTSSYFGISAEVIFYDQNDDPINTYSITTTQYFTLGQGELQGLRTYYPEEETHSTSKSYITQVFNNSSSYFNKYQVRFITDKKPSRGTIRFFTRDEVYNYYQNNTNTGDVYQSGISKYMTNTNFGYWIYWGPIYFKLSKWE